jgi:hypothetical protein
LSGLIYPTKNLSQSSSRRGASVLKATSPFISTFRDGIHAYGNPYVKGNPPSNFSVNIRPERTGLFIFILFSAVLSQFAMALAQPENPQADEVCWVSPEYERYKPNTVAVLPLDNLSLEPDLEIIFHQFVYDQLKRKGYQRISAQRLKEWTLKVGIQTPGQLMGISLKRVKDDLRSDAVLFGQIDQSASIHQGFYDAFVISTSLKMVHCATGKVLWACDQFRSAHRQWQLDPINALINLAAHGLTSRENQLAWLVQEMFRTIPSGPVQIEIGDLLQQAQPIKAQD